MSKQLQEAKIETNKRFDKALYTYMRVDATEENARELKAAAEALNKAIDAAEAADKEENATIIEKLTVDLMMAASRVNSDAEGKDTNRNHVNYGIVTQAAATLRLLGQEVETPCYGDGDYLKIPKVIINGKETTYQNGQIRTAAVRKARPAQIKAEVKTMNGYVIKCMYTEGKHKGQEFVLSKGGYVADRTDVFLEDEVYKTEKTAKMVATKLNKQNEYDSRHNHSVISPCRHSILAVEYKTEDT